MKPSARALHSMDLVFRKLESKTPQPQKIKRGDGFAFRYIEKDLMQAFLLKLARNISGVRAILILFNSGYFQEQAIIQRTLDEIGEDLIFLSFGMRYEFTDDHNKYLEAFWAEEIDRDNINNVISKKGPRRVKIRKYIDSIMIENQLINATDPNYPRIVYDAYSGYVHAASPQIMDMLDGHPPHFHLEGMRHTPREAEHEYDLWNYIYRGLLNCIIVSERFGESDLVDFLYDEVDEFKKSTGRDV